MNSQFKRFIESLASPKGPGPSTTFSMFHIFYALELLAEKPIGRNKLAEKLNVGEGAIRTIVSRLREAGLIVTSKEGCILTDKGLSLWKSFVEVYPKRVEIGKTALTTSKFNYAFLVKNRAHKVGSGIDQRDAAIMGGARRALVIVCRNGRLMIESVSNSIEEEFPEAAGEILEKLGPENNDVVVIAGADDPLRARRGAFAASWVLIGDGEKK
jgi:predicted transcriptional regulator